MATCSVSASAGRYDPATEPIAPLANEPFRPAALRATKLVSLQSPVGYRRRPAC